MQLFNTIKINFVAINEQQAVKMGIGQIGILLF